MMCPECAQGKTPNCTGQALDPDTDRFVTCETVTTAILPGPRSLPPLEGYWTQSASGGAVLYCVDCLTGDHVERATLIADGLSVCRSHGLRRVAS